MSTGNLQRHIIKCMVNYPHHKTCPYNARHRFLHEKDFVQHMSQCPNRNFAWVKPNYPVHGDLRELKSEPPNMRKWNLELENWDDE